CRVSSELTSTVTSIVDDNGFASSRSTDPVTFPKRPRTVAIMRCLTAKPTSAWAPSTVQVVCVVLLIGMPSVGLCVWMQISSYTIITYMNIMDRETLLAGALRTSSYADLC